MIEHALIAPMAAHVGLAALLYALLTMARAPKVWGIGKRADGSNPYSTIEPRLSANLSNQFEWSLFFHVACLLIIQIQRVSFAAVALAWVFVAGRVMHSCIQILTSNVRLRGLVFTLNFAAVIALWVIILGAGS